MALQEFRANLASKGLARSSKWLVRVYAPRGVTASGGALGRLLGGSFDINLPILDAIDETVGVLNDIDVSLGGLNVNFNPNVPTLGFAVSGEAEGLRAINLFTSDVELPGRDINEVERRTEGELRSIGYLTSHQNLNISYYCTESLAEKEFFETWQDVVYNKDKVASVYYDDYKSRIEVIKYNASFKKDVAKYQFNECYPTNIGAISLDSIGDGVVKLQMQFKFRNYDRIK